MYHLSIHMFVQSLEVRNRLRIARELQEICADVLSIDTHSLRVLKIGVKPDPQLGIP